MTAQILDGKKVAEHMFDYIRRAVSDRKEQGLVPPGLAVVLVGDDPASRIYVKNKRQACEKVGIFSKAIDLPGDTSQEALYSIIEELNDDPAIHGILVQLPLPDHFDVEIILEAIHPEKDVDGFHPYNVGRLVQGFPLFHACTPYGVMHLFEFMDIDLAGKDAVVVGASTIVGRPMALELLAADCTVTICHRKTKDLPKKLKQADIVVVAIGDPQFIKASWIKKGAIVIDIGMNKLPNGKLVGDVDFDAVKKKASWITPVPGGAGPMTIATLLENTLFAASLCD